MNVNITDPQYQNKLFLINILSGIVDPELGVNLIDLGLIYDIMIRDPVKRIIITMTLSTPSCPVGGIIKNNVAQMVEASFPDYTVKVDVVFTPLWSLDMMTETGKSALGW